MKLLNKYTLSWIIIFAAIILPVIILATYSFSRLERNISATIYKEKTAIASLSSTILKERFERMEDLSVSIATRVKFSECLCTNKWEEAVAIVNDIPNNFPFIERVFITDTSGILLGDVPKAVPSVHGMDFSHRDWYKGVRRVGTTYISEVYRRKASPAYNVIAVATPVRSSANSAVICGYLVLQIRLETILEWSREIEPGKKGSVSIIDHHGNIAASAELDPKKEITKYNDAFILKKLRNGENGIDVFKNDTTGSNNLIAYETVDKFGWGVLIQQPEDEAYAEMHRSLGIIIIIYAIILIISFASAYLIIRNIRNRVKAEKIIRQKSEELEQSNQELEQFVYVASHDLQEPLRTISNFTGLIEEKYAGNSVEDDRYLKYISGATGKMQDLIKDLLDLSRVNNQQMEVIDCNTIVAEVIDSLERSIAESDAIVSVSTLPVVYGSEMGLRQVFQNLISNAIKFSKKGIRPEIQISAEEKDGFYLFTIKDNGIGIEQQYSDRIFIIFQRLHRDTDYPGTGIGLATCKKIISLHKGKIWMKSAPGEGSTFYFTIPVSKV